MRINVIGFIGMQPLGNPELMADNASTVATNCLLESTEIVPLRGTTVDTTSAKVGNLVSAYRMVEGASAAWMAWPFDVDVAKMQFPSVTRYIYTGENEPRITTYALAISGGASDYPHSYRALGIPAPTTAPTVTPPAGGTPVTRFYGYTYMSDWGEESALSPITASLIGNPTGTWAITGMNTTPVFSDGRTAPIGTCTINLYRTEGSSGQWMLVNSTPISSSSYDDTVTAASLPGDTLISTTYEVPPKYLRGVKLHPSGALVGFYDNVLCFSEPFQPHAWPTAYQMQAKSKIVAIEIIGTTVAVLTDSRPQLCFGQEPGAMQMSDPGEAMPCLSKRSVVSFGDRVGFATDAGYATISENGVDILTQAIWDYHTWHRMNPANTFAVYASGRLHLVVHPSSRAQWYVFSMRSNLLTTSSYLPNALCTDVTTGNVYFLTGSNINTWNDGAATFQYAEWIGKLFHLPHPINFAAARIRFDGVLSDADIAALEAARAAAIATNAPIVASGNAKGAYNAKPFNTLRYGASLLQFVPSPATDSVGVVFNIFDDNGLKYSKTILNEEPFRLPSGFKIRRMRVGTVSQACVKSIELAESMAGLNVA